MTYTDLGYLCLVLALGLSIYGSIVPHLGVKYNNWNLVRSVQHSSLCIFFLMAIASAVLFRALIISDFSVDYVWGHSSVDMPLFYKITSFWGGMEGSLLLWGLVQAGFLAFVAWMYERRNRELLPYIIMVLNMIMVFLLILLVGWSNPLGVLMPAPEVGRGLNPLLQNPGMVIHPPSLYLGYIGFSVPFAFAMAGLLRGKLDNEWVISTRRWTLFAWFFLTLGLFLGGQWAYEELGWGGYWAWDPVENAALMPWLTGTAFLHSVMVQERRNMFRIWNIVLILITFALSILGTFITRSGVINSVHSFAQSEIGPAFLVFLALILIVGVGLIFKRVHVLESEYQMESVLCKENVFLMQNVLFVGIAFTVLLGTTFPLLAEAIRGTKLSIQAPFFNTIVSPMGILLFFLMGIGTLIAWRRSSMSSLKKNFQAPLATATLLTPVIAAVAPAARHIGALLIFWIAIFVTATIVFEVLKAASVKSKQMGVNWLLGLMYVFLRNPRRYGGLLIHLGAVLLYIGFAGRFFGIEQNFTLKPGVPQTIGSYQLVFQEVREFPVRNATHRAAIVDVYLEGQKISTLEPAKSFYPTQPDPLTEVGIQRRMWEDLYLVFASENPGSQSVSIKAYINPLVGWAWMSLPMFTLGFFVCMLYQPKTLAVREELQSYSNLKTV